MNLLMPGFSPSLRSVAERLPLAPSPTLGEGEPDSSSPLPSLGEGSGVRANPLCNDRPYLIYDP